MAMNTVKQQGSQRQNQAERLYWRAAVKTGCFCIVLTLYGSNVIFYVLTSAGPGGGVECWNTSRGALHMLMYQKISVFDRYNCIKTIFPLENIGENALKISFIVYL